jgi:1,2-diacylglycerol 3-alpha-glucosyltransferase
MTVGLVSEWFSRGAGYVGRQYREVLEAQGCEVYVYARGDRHVERGPEWEDERVQQGVPCRIGKPKAIYAPDYLAWLRRIRPDVVLFNEQQWLPPVLWTRDEGIKTAAYVDYYTWASVGSFEWYDALICNTHRHASTFGWHLGSHFLPWGTNIRKFVPVPRVQRPITFLHSAGWDPERKGTDQVLRCWLKLRPGTRLVLHSQADITGIIQSERCAAALDRGELIVLSGTIKPEMLFQLGDVYVYPSHLEGIGLTLAEAVSSGLPIIVPDDGPMNEFCLDSASVRVPLSRRYRRGDGYYWPCNDISDVDLVAAMEGFAGADGPTVARWRRDCQAMAVEQLDWSINSADLRRILEIAPTRLVDPSIANASGRVYPSAAKVLSVAGRAAARVLGERIVSSA